MRYVFRLFFKGIFIVHVITNYLDLEIKALFYSLFMSVRRHILSIILNLLN